MKSLRHLVRVLMVFAGSAAWLPSPARACAACYGRSDSPLASGMNWGIFTLLGVVVTVLVSIASFFIYIIRKETARTRTEPAAPNLSEAKI
jgi:heme/copper-type cytochrome/quinol oxidase subunit 2